MAVTVAVLHSATLPGHERKFRDLLFRPLRLENELLLQKNLRMMNHATPPPTTTTTLTTTTTTMTPPRTRIESYVEICMTSRFLHLEANHIGQGSATMKIPPFFIIEGFYYRVVDVVVVFIVVVIVVVASFAFP